MNLTSTQIYSLGIFATAILLALFNCPILHGILVGLYVLAFALAYFDDSPRSTREFKRLVDSYRQPGYHHHLVVDIIGYLLMLIASLGHLTWFNSLLVLLMCLGDMGFRFCSYQEV